MIHIKLPNIRRKSYLSSKVFEANLNDRIIQANLMKLSLKIHLVVKDFKRILNLVYTKIADSRHISRNEIPTYIYHCQKLYSFCRNGNHLGEKGRN